MQQSRGMLLITLEVLLKKNELVKLKGVQINGNPLQRLPNITNLSFKNKNALLKILIL